MTTPLPAAPAALSNGDSHTLEPLCFPLWGSRLIEASAGTGKTWTIAALYLRLVLGHGGDNAFVQPLRPADILVMTFTRAATRELSDRIRARLLPVLNVVFPAFRDTFARSAAHAAQASTLLHELAQQDLATVGTPPQLAALQALSSARQANVLRHWLRSSHQTTPSAAQLAELQRQIGACTTRGHRIRLKVGRGTVERIGSGLHWYNPPGFGPIFA